MKGLFALVLCLAMSDFAGADWASYAASPEFQAMDYSERREARDRYWQKNIKPNAPEGEISRIRDEFMAGTAADVAPPLRYQHIDRDPELVATEEEAKRELAECVLEHMKGVQSDRAARAILGACRITTGATN